MVKNLLLFIAAFLAFGSALAAANESIVTLWNGDKYVLEDRVGDGYFGVVYFAKSKADGSEVALKFFKKMSHFEYELSARFKNLYHSQAKSYVVQQLSKGVLKSIEGAAPHELTLVVGVIVLARVDGTLYDSGFADRTRLADYDRHPLNLSDADFAKRTKFLRDLIFQTMKLWAGMASNRVIHGDIKPGNIGYVQNPFQIKLLDIGSFRIGPLGNDSNIRFAHTPYTAAPETYDYGEKQLPEGEYYSSFGDLFSLGITISELICSVCNREQIYEVLESWSKRLSDSAENRASLNRLNLAADFIHAATAYDAVDRYTEIQNGVLGKLIKFRGRRGADSNYAFLQATVVPHSPEEMEKIYSIYKPAWPKRIVNQVSSSEPEEQPAQEEEIEKRAIVKAKPKTGPVRRFFRKCADILRGIIRF